MTTTEIDRCRYCEGEKVSDFCPVCFGEDDDVGDPEWLGSSMTGYITHETYSARLRKCRELREAAKAAGSKWLDGYGTARVVPDFSDPMEEPDDDEDSSASDPAWCRPARKGE